MTHAVYETKSAWLSSEFGESYARRLMGDEAVDNLPRYVRGKRKGCLKGRLIWKKCVHGGWVGKGSIPDGGGPVGFVEYRVGKTTDAVLVHGEWGEPEKVIASYTAPVFHGGREMPGHPDPLFWRYA